MNHRDHATTPGRVRLDLARGVIMAWTGCEGPSAFTQLLTVAALHGVSVFDLADAVLTAARRDPHAQCPSELAAVVLRRWDSGTDPTHATVPA